jgi:peptide/nickel transport system permease protein
VSDQAAPSNVSDSTTDSTTGSTVRRPSAWRDAGRAVLGSWTGRLGLALVGIMVGAALVSLVWVPHDPTRVVPQDRWLPISWEHWFGTDGGGKDLFSQVLVGARTTLFVAVASAVIAGVVGLALGLLAAMTPRLVGDSVAYVIDVLIAIPTLLLALVLVAVFQGSLWTVSVAIGAGSGVVLARVVRAEVARVLTQDYIAAARAAGTSTPATIRRHILPNIAPVVIVQLSLVAALAVLAEAALSYLGLTPVSTPSWGRMLEGLQQSVTVHPGAIVFPGLAVVLATLGFNLLGDGLRDAIDPRLRGRSAAPTPDLTAAVDRSARQVTS